MQATINKVLAEKFGDHEWASGSGCFLKGKTWVRVTFRHQMSLGSDFLDALKVCKKQGVKTAIIPAADEETLKVISPNDCKALVSLEKLCRQLYDLDAAMDIPLLIGKLTPKTQASLRVEREIKKERKRDLTVPNPEQ